MTKGKPHKSPLAETKERAKIKVKVRKSRSGKANTQLPLQLTIPEQISQQLIQEIPKISGYDVIAEQAPSISTEEEFERKRLAAQITAQELLDKPLEELEKDVSRRETRNMLKELKIITAIMLGKNKNKELAQMLNTDKSFASKQIRDLEEQGLVRREGEGKETKYAVNPFDVMKFLESKVVIKWGKSEKKTDDKTEKTYAQEKKDGK